MPSRREATIHTLEADWFWPDLREDAREWWEACEHGILSSG